jgi:hypothetical protein
MMARREKPLGSRRSLNADLVNKVVGIVGLVVGIAPLGLGIFTLRLHERLLAAILTLLVAALATAVVMAFTKRDSRTLKIATLVLVVCVLGVAVLLGTSIKTRYVDRVVAQGTVVNLDDAHGVDLDRSPETGAIGPDNAPAQDISPSARASSFGLTGEGVQAAVLQTTGDEDVDRCANLKDTDWAARSDGVGKLQKMPPGTNICFRTSSGNLSMVTIQRTPDNSSGTIDFRYRTWRPDTA